jgi:hypothetical protein
MAMKSAPRQTDPNDVVVALTSAGSVVFELWYANGSCLEEKDGQLATTDMLSNNAT